MSNETDLTTMERAAYADSFSDGILDVFFGLSVLWIGAAWLWLPDFAALAGIIPAALTVPVIQGRAHITETRTGYVRWSERRRQSEHSRLVQMLALGVLLAGIGLLAVLTSTKTVIAPALPAGLLGLIALVLGMASGLWRVVVYGAALIAAGTTTALVGADPGIDMLVSGSFIITWGVILLVTYLDRHPRRSS